MNVAILMAQRGIISVSIRAGSGFHSIAQPASEGPHMSKLTADEIIFAEAKVLKCVFGHTNYHVSGSKLLATSTSLGPSPPPRA